MTTYIIDNGSKYIQALEESLRQLNPLVVEYSKLGQTRLSDDDLIILSGGHKTPVLWHNDEYKNEIAIIQKHEGPIIGICLGFELISHVFGSHLHLLKRRRKGNIVIHPVGENTIVKVKQSFNVYENHNWSVEKLNLPLRALAVSSDGVEVLKHITRPIYGLQFHPEARDSDGCIILQNIFDELKRLQFVTEGID